MLKIIIGLILGVAIGVVCRLVALPLPAPPVLSGALLVVAMTLGHIAVGAVLAHRDQDGGGPDGGRATAKTEAAS